LRWARSLPTDKLEITRAYASQIVSVLARTDADLFAVGPTA